MAVLGFQTPFKIQFKKKKENFEIATLFNWKFLATPLAAATQHNPYHKLQENNKI